MSYKKMINSRFATFVILIALALIALFFLKSVGADSNRQYVFNYGPQYTGTLRTAQASIYLSGTHTFTRELINGTTRTYQVSAGNPEALGDLQRYADQGKPVTIQGWIKKVALEGGFYKLTANRVRLARVTATPPPSSTNPIINRITPSFGPAGAQVTLTGRNFSDDNSVTINGRERAVTRLTSPSGTSLAFRLPFTPCTEGEVCAQVVATGFYSIVVVNTAGTSNRVNFDITADTAKTGPGTLLGDVTYSSGPPCNAATAPCNIARNYNVIINKADGTRVTTIATDNEGRYTTPLAAGDYVIYTQNGPSVNDKKTNTATVRPEETTRLDLQIDTGAR